MNGADLLARMLVAYGVEYIFGVPGDTNVTLYAGLERHAPAIRHIMARDERNAGFMADAYARASNRPGVVEVPSGAGPLYVIAAVAEAHVSAAPVIIITNDNPLPVEGRGFIAELDCKKLFEPVTKASIQVKAVEKIPETIRRAFRIATSGKPGAVHLAIPENLYHQEIDERTISLHAEKECKRFPAYRAHPSRDDLLALRGLIDAAKRPLIIAGGGVNRSEGRAALTAFAEYYRLPVVTTITGQQAIADDHELSIGVIGDNGFHPHAARAMEEADLLIYLGCRNGSTVSISWTWPLPNPSRRVAHIDVDPEVLGNNAENALSIVADARALCEDMIAFAPLECEREPEGWLATLADWRRRFWREADRELAELREATPTPIRPRLAIEALAKHLEGPVLLYSDPGTPTPYLCRYLKLAHPDARIIMQRAFGGLGYALPAVVGGWFARQGVRPIGLFGDGSLGMSIGDLETIARLNIPAILINFNNASFGWIEALQKVQGHNKPMSVRFSQTDYGAIASAFGLMGIRVEAADQVEKAFDQAFAHDGPVFLDLVVESVADRLPPLFNWLRKTGADPLIVGGEPLTLEGART
ncbi:thiamine pyrophosphate-binding protein [Terricaulis sp.]|uniref:thiamine pyrophosphate-binding protein n=1 Tax=Terricaulis sp. TaxID=2768686 RepID=UPI00378431D8